MFENLYKNIEINSSTLRIQFFDLYKLVLKGALLFKLYGSQYKSLIFAGM